MPCTDQDCRHCTHSDAVAVTYATEIARDLIANQPPAATADPAAVESWIGRALTVMRELTRDA